MLDSQVVDKSQQAYQQLRQLIIDGAISSGERLSELKVTQLLGTGRGPARASLMRLEAEGMLTAQGKRRSRVVTPVFTPSRSEILYRFELRERIESGAVRLAAQQMNRWQIEHLRRLATRSTETLASSDRTMRCRFANEYYDYLLDHCGNPLFKTVWRTFQLTVPIIQSDELNELVLSVVPAAERNRPTSLEVVDAIANHDGELAEQLVKTRLRRMTHALRLATWDSASGGETPARIRDVE